MIAPLVQEYRDGLERGELLVQSCSACNEPNMYPRYACPFCQSEELGWREASGKGVLHSFTVLRGGAPSGFEGELPYALGVVKLEEGVQLLARLVPDDDGAWSDYTCDAPVEFAPSVGDGSSVAWFRPAGSDGR